MRAGPIAVVILIGLCLTIRVTAQQIFKDVERARIVAFWASPTRYSVSVPERSGTAPWQVRLTPEGSTWLWKYQQAIGASKAPPTADPTAQSGGVSAWRDWVTRKIAYDRWLTQQTATRLNTNTAPRQLTGLDADRSSLPGRGEPRALRNQESSANGTAAPAFPGLIPSDLLTAVGDPPPFAAAVIPLQHSVQFDEGDSYTYEDNTAVSPAYAYYRFPQGVGTGGSPVSEADRALLFDAAGLTEIQKHVMMAVSRLEGSFDAVNTYDTGFVSVGFIQFITLEDGKHSLCEVLSHEKRDAPADFERDFRRFGIDLDPNGVVVALDPATGAELIGPVAVRKIVDDKRLIAVFQKAGKTSTAFRVAQIRVAKESYWPEDDPILVEVNGRTLTGKVSDIIRSEAGLATLFDRKVNRGTVAPLADVAAKTMRVHRLSQLTDLQKYEREIVAACKYRTDFLADNTLQQPGK